MIAVDTSVVIAGFASWHESHGLAAQVIADRPILPAPCALETYAVLTRLPSPHRAEPTVVRDYLAIAFPDGPLAMPRAQAAKLVATIVDRGVAGGASYDAVVALIAAHAGATLVTLDLRARPTYERVGVPIRLLA
jgi:predicted nucleic acid-binding protein